MASAASREYQSGMIRAASMLLALAAMLLMPFGMSAASAAPSHRAPMAMAAMGHCGDSAPGRSPAPSHSDCAISCTALLATTAQAPEPARLAALPALPRLAEPFSGLVPETATPPPKRA